MDRKKVSKSPSKLESQLLLEKTNCDWASSHSGIVYLGNTTSNLMILHATDILSSENKAKNIKTEKKNEKERQKSKQTKQKKKKQSKNPMQKKKKINSS